MNTEVVFTCKINEILSLTGKWIELDILMLNETSETQKDGMSQIDVDDYAMQRKLWTKETIIWYNCTDGKYQKMQTGIWW